MTVCFACGKDIAVRPVWTEVRHPHPERAAQGARVRKRVHMKPLQMVLGVRLEGAPGERAQWDNLPTDLPAMAACGACIAALSFVELVRVYLDRLEEVHPAATLRPVRRADDAERHALVDLLR